MQTVRTLLAALLSLGAASTAWPQETDALVLVAHPSVEHIDKTAALRLYTGRAIEVDGRPVVVVNLARGNKLRERFMSTVLGQDDNKFIAYWTVRQHIGKGTPPRELPSDADVIAFVQKTPGAIGYIASASLQPSMNVVFRP